MTNEDVFQSALRLPSDLRADLALRLIQSLDGESLDESEVLDAWGEETKRRLELYKRGDLPTEDWETARQELRARNS